LRHRAARRKKSAPEGSAGRRSSRGDDSVSFALFVKSEATMSIPAIPNSILQYLRRFDLCSVAQSRDGGRLVATRDPQGYHRAWWCNSLDAGRVIRAARADSGNVVKAAAALGVKLAPHDYVMQHTEQIIAKLDARLASAQKTGALLIKEFNASYREYRRAKFVAGQPAMGYSAARSLLRKVLVEAAAGKASPGFVRRVFDDGLPDP
jgi:hypothetical protein